MGEKEYDNEHITIGEIQVFGLSIVKFVGTISLSTRLYVLKLP